MGKPQQHQTLPEQIRIDSVRASFVGLLPYVWTVFVNERMEAEQVKGVDEAGKVLL
jgi:hypothetical protein